MKYVKHYDNISNKSRHRKSTTRVDRMIYRLSIRKIVSRGHCWYSCRNFGTRTAHLNISMHTIRCRLTEFWLRGRVARQKPLINKKNRKVRLLFAKEQSIGHASNGRKLCLLMNWNLIASAPMVKRMFGVVQVKNSKKGI